MKASRFNFRAWVFGRDIMVIPDAIWWNGQKVTFGTREFYTDLFPEIDEVADYDKCVFMQSTGLVDRNGKEMFEGDIVRVLMSEKWQHNPYRERFAPFVEVVQWNEDESGFDPIISVDTEAFNFEYEIIGNVYENPELIENPPPEKQR